MKAVVLGATGFLGSHVTERLAAEGFQVTAVSRSGSAPAGRFGAKPVAGSIRPLGLDLTDERCVERLSAELGPDVTLIHLAARCSGGSAQLGPVDRDALFDLNVLGTLRVLDAARRTRGGVRAVVYASSFEVYGAPTTTELVSEATRTLPIDEYGVTMLAGEDHLLAFSEEEGVRAVVLRFAELYGSGRREFGTIRALLRTVAHGERAPLQGDGSVRYETLHVFDAVCAVERAIFAEAHGLYNVSDGAQHSLRELVNTAMAVGGMDGEPEPAPATLRRFDSYMSIERARNQLGFEPRVRLADGMREELDWLKTEGTG